MVSRLLPFLLLLSALQMLFARCARSQTQREDSLQNRNAEIDAIDEQFFQAIADDNNGPSTMDEWLDEIRLLRSFPVSLRRATRDELSRIPTLDRFEVERILSMRDSAASTSKDDADGFVTDERSIPSTLRLRSRTIIDPNASSQAGFTNGNFLGPPGEYYNELQAGVGIVQGAVLQAKYPGEPRFDDLLRGYVSLSEPIRLTNDLSITQIALGNYKLSYGNGLSFGKTSTSVKTHDAVKAVNPHSSGISGTISSAALQGAAASIAIGNASIAAFYSNTPFDAAIDSTNEITSILNGSYHRTASEIANRYDAMVKLFGGHAQIDEPLTKTIVAEIGATGYSSMLDHPISASARSSKIGTQHESLVSLNEAAQSNDLIFSVEEGMSVSDTSRAYALASSLTLRAAPGLDFALEYRNLPPNYLSRSSAVFGERSAYGENEQGIYLGMDWEPYENILSLAAYTDLSRTLSTTATAPFPISTNDYLLGITLSPDDPNQTMYFQFHRKAKDELLNTTDSTGLTHSATGLRTQTNYLLQFKIMFARNLTLKAEGQFVAVAHQSPSVTPLASGYLASVGPELQFPHLFTVETRVILYSTSNYDARLYQYEPDIPGAATFAPLYTTGLRYFVLISAWPASEIRFAAKIAVTRFNGQRTIGSGLTAYSGDSETRIGLQADIRF